MKKTRFLHLTIDSRYGGVYRFIENWAEGEDDNINLIHCTFNYQNSICNKIFRYRNNPSNLREQSGYLLVIDLILNFPLYLKYSLSSDFIILHSTFLFPIAIFLNLFNKRSIIISHDFNNPLIIRIIINILFNSKIICVAPWLKDFFKLSSKSSIIKNIFDTHNNIKVFLPVSRSYLDSTLIKNFSFNKIENNIISFVYVGSLSPVKGIEDFIKLIGNKFYRVNLNIIGKRLERYTKNFSPITDDVNLNFYGEIFSNEIKNQIVDKANFAIIPSRSEVFPFVYSEYIRYGIIPICTYLDAFVKVTKLTDHIYERGNQKSLIKVLDWAYNLDEISYKKYVDKLNQDFYDFLDNYQTSDSLTLFILRQLNLKV